MLNTFNQAVAGAVLALSAAVPAFAQDAYPDRPITVVISGQVGGTIDVMARQLAPFWEKELGQPLQIDNRSGAAGVTGVRYFMEQPDDGYVILIGTEAHFSAAVERDPNLSSMDVELINMHQFDPAAVTVLESSPYGSLKELVEAAKAAPDTITWGSPPTGAPALVGHLLARTWDVPMRFIPQAGGVESDTALLGGHVDVKLGTASGDSTELPGARVLAIAGEERLPYLPDTPTINEVGAELGLGAIPDFGSARLIVAHASMKEQHPQRFEKLASSYRAAIDAPEYQALLEAAGPTGYVARYTPDEATEAFRALVDDTARYKAELGGQ